MAGESLSPRTLSVCPWINWHNVGRKKHRWHTLMLLIRATFPDNTLFYLAGDQLKDHRRAFSILESHPWRKTTSSAFEPLGAYYLEKGGKVIVLSSQVSLTLLGNQEGVYRQKPIVPATNHTKQGKQIVVEFLHLYHMRYFKLILILNDIERNWHLLTFLYRIVMF